MSDDRFAKGMEVRKAVLGAEHVARAEADLSAMHHALIQEHERATHGWQVEWLTLPLECAGGSRQLSGRNVAHHRSRPGWREEAFRPIKDGKP